MKKTIKTLLLCFLAVFGVTSIAQAQVKSSTNTVPDNYYANYKFINDWNQIWDIFNAMKSRNSLGMSIDSSYFSDLYTHFSRSFPHLTKDYSATYEKCLLLASSRDVDALL